MKLIRWVGKTLADIWDGLAHGFDLIPPIMMVPLVVLAIIGWTHALK